MNPTLAQARADLHGIVSGATQNLVAVYDVEPINEVDGPAWATVALEGFDVTRQRWQVRIYVDYRDDGADSARTLDEALGEVEDALAADDRYEAGSWTIGVDPAIGCWVARTTVLRGREDF